MAKWVRYRIRTTPMAEDVHVLALAPALVLAAVEQAVLEKISTGQSFIQKIFMRL